MSRFQLNERRYTIWDYVRILWQISPVMLSLIIATAVLMSLEPTLYALCTASFVDTVLSIFEGKQTAYAVIWPIVFVVAVVAINWTFRSITHFCWVRLRLRTTEQYMTALLTKKAKLSYLHIENADSQDLIKRVCGQDLAVGSTKFEPVEQIVMGYVDLQNTVTTFTRIAGLLAIFFTYAWWSALVVILLSLPLFIVSINNGKRNYGAKKQIQADVRMIEYIGDLLRGREHTEERSLFGYSNRLNRLFGKHVDIAVSEQEKAERKSMIKSNLASICSVAIWFIIALSLLPSVGVQTVTVGMYIALIGSVTDIVDVMGRRLARCAEGLARNQEYMRDLTAFAHMEEASDALDKPEKSAGEIEEIQFENVRFTYPGSQKAVLNGVNLVIQKGRRYAFVGANGAGKTTLINLLTGLYTEYEGKIWVNGKELRGISASEHKALFTVVHQDFARYSISIRDNIALGNVNRMEDLDFSDCIENAVSAVGLEREVGNLPDGLDTEAGKLHERGHDLSGGQWQRVAIARSLVSDAPVVILDEPTAALDPLAEAALYKEFDKISRGKTSIFISHRLGSTKLADTIYVIDNGTIRETGTHDELMDQDGLYAEMYRAQQEWYS